MTSHNVVHVMLGKHLSILILGLRVVANDGYDVLIGSVIYMVGHGGLLGDMFDIAGHDPSMLKIPAKLHALNPLPKPTSNILKMKTLSVLSP